MNTTIKYSRRSIEKEARKTDDINHITILMFQFVQYFADDKSPQDCRVILIKFCEAEEMRIQRATKVRDSRKICDPILSICFDK